MLFDFKHRLKRFTFWLITSVSKNNYCHMVCGLGFRRIKSLLLPIVLFSHLLPTLEKPTCTIENLKLCRLLKSRLCQFASSSSLFKGIMQKPHQSSSSDGFMEPGCEAREGTCNLPAWGLPLAFLVSVETFLGMKPLSAAWEWLRSRASGPGRPGPES